MVNKRWCIDSKLISTLCSRDLETITVDCRPFYSPREFASIVLMGVYIPPRCRRNQCDEIACCSGNGNRISSS